MEYTYDIIILAILALGAFGGAKRGFIKTFFSFFGKVLAFAVAWFSSRPVSLWLSDGVVYPVLKSRFSQWLTEYLGKDSTNLDFNLLPEELEAFLLRFGIQSEGLLSNFSGVVAEGKQGLEAVCEGVVKPLSESLSYLIAFVVIFFVASVFIGFLVRVLDLISKISILKVPNRILGFVLGLAEGVLISALLSTILLWIASFVAEGETSFFSVCDPSKSVLVRLFGFFA